MVRLVAFIVLAMILSRVLGVLPIIGPFFAHTGFFGVWVTAIGLSIAATSYGERALRSRRDRAELRRLETVDNAHNHGKAGALLLARGDARKALPHLLRAAAGEPRVAEWQFRLGMALLALRRPAEARTALARCTELEPEHAYGGAQLRLAEALTAVGQPEDALPVLAVAERNHGPSPELAYRRGLALKAAGRRSEAKASFAEVSRLAAQAPKFQRGSARAFAVRARVAGLF